MKTRLIFSANDRHNAPPTFGRGIPRRLPDPSGGDLRWWADQNEGSRDRGCPLRVYMARDAGRYVPLHARRFA